MSKGKWQTIGLIAATLGTLAAAPAKAQAISDKYWLEGQAYFASVDTDVSVSANGLNGTDVDLEKDLGLNDSKALPAVLIGARVGSNISIIGEYYQLGRDGTRTIDRDINFDGVTYTANGEVKSSFDSKIYRLAIGYSFIHNEKADVGASLGAHITDFSTQLVGNAVVNGTPVTAESKKRSTTAPLPTIGLFGTYEVAPAITVGARVDWLKLTIGDYEGKLVNAQASAVYRFTKNVGVGAAYRYVKYRLKVDKTDWQGQVDYTFNGPAIFLQVGF